jgi:uncharacterized membrane protein YfcA
MRRYAAAWGIIIGGAIGAVIGIPLHASAELLITFSLVGLIVGYVLSHQGKAGAPTDAAVKPDTADRLKELDRLRSESLIAEEEYQAKRRQILDEI